MPLMGQKRTTPKQGLKRKLPTLWELDRIFSGYIRRWGVCERCNRAYMYTDNLETHHFISRFFIKLRGQERVESLRKQARTYHKLDRLAVLEKLKCLSL